MCAMVNEAFVSISPILRQRAREVALQGFKSALKQSGELNAARSDGTTDQRCCHDSASQ